MSNLNGKISEQQAIGHVSRVSNLTSRDVGMTGTRATSALLHPALNNAGA